mmetsp:Transcript_39122/g.96293  ORF Transcript_39122/g.96293 Transcript_39122/m.96293 type:complete len:218 (-) Transcript_39122:111-764(-)
MMCLRRRSEGSLVRLTTMLLSTLLTAKKRSAVAHTYCSPMSSSRIFCTMKVATVLDSSLPVSMIRRHSGMISVVSRKLITSVSSILTSAPMTPRLVSRKYSKGRVLEMVLRKGYRNRGMCALRNTVRVSGCEATHCSSASALHTRFEACAVSCGGESSGYMHMISCKSVAVVPNECHNIGARSGYASLFFDSSSRAASLVSSLDRSATSWYSFSLSC